MSGQLTALIAQVSGEPLRGDVAPYIVLFAVGFLIAIAGHLMQSRPVILTGIALSAIGSLLPMLRWGFS